MLFRRRTAETDRQVDTHDFQSQRALLIDRALRGYALVVGGEDFAATLPTCDPDDTAASIIQSAQIIDTIEQHFPGHGDLAAEHARVVAVDALYAAVHRQRQTN